MNQHAHEWRVGRDEDHKILLVMISTETQEQRSIVWKFLTSADKQETFTDFLPVNMNTRDQYEL